MIGEVNIVNQRRQVKLALTAVWVPDFGRDKADPLTVLRVDIKNVII